MLVDTSVWVDYFRRGNDLLADRLRGGEVWTHPFVIGELACGILERRREILGLRAALPHAPLLDHQEVLDASVLISAGGGRGRARPDP